MKNKRYRNYEKNKTQTDENLVLPKEQVEIADL